MSPPICPIPIRPSKTPIKWAGVRVSHSLYRDSDTNRDHRSKGKRHPAQVPGALYPCCAGAGTILGRAALPRPPIFPPRGRKSFTRSRGERGGTLRCGDQRRRSEAGCQWSVPGARQSRRAVPAPRRLLQAACQGTRHVSAGTLDFRISCFTAGLV